MRTASRRITRKDIRQPDRFVVLTRRFVALAKENQTALIAGVAAFVFVVVALAGWSLYRGRQNRLAAEEYARAVDLYHEGKYKESLDALARLEVYSSTYYSRMGLLYAANAQSALQNSNAAVESLRRLLDREKKDPLLRQTAYVSLGYTQEQRGQWADAAQSYVEAEKIAGPLKTDASLGKARSYAQAGNAKEAIASYKKISRRQSRFRPRERDLRSPPRAGGEGRLPACEINPERFPPDAGPACLVGRV